MTTPAEALRGEALDAMWKAVNLETARDCLWQLERYETPGTPEQQKRQQILLGVCQKKLEEECAKAMEGAHAALGDWIESARETVVVPVEPTPTNGLSVPSV